MSQQVNGRIMNYRTGIRAQTNTEILIQLIGMTDVSEAGKLVGKKVVWQQSKKTVAHYGRVIGLHGKNGVVKAKFSKGVPGQAIGGTVQIVA